MMFGEKELAGEEISSPDANIATLLRKRGVDANSLLYEASKRNRVARMEELVREWGADPNSAVAHADGALVAPPLFAAVVGSAATAAEWLLRAGADPDGKCFVDGSCVTPLWTAAENGNVRLGKLLLDRGADVDAAKSPSGNTPLYVAVQNHHPAMVSLLLSFGADPNKCLRPRALHTLSPLEVAIGCGHPRIIAQLINAEAEISLGAVRILAQIQNTKISIDQFKRSISDEELEHIKDLLVAKPYLKDNSTYESAKAAEREGDYRKALELLGSLHVKCPCTQVNLDIDRIVEAIYGVRGSDCTISIWDSVPLMTQTEPTYYQDYAWTQMARKIYRHGGIDNTGEIKQRDELWELDLDTRIWRLLKTSGKSPGPRTGHKLFAWEGALYAWGGRCEMQRFDTKLYRLAIKKNEPLSWSTVKTTMKPPGREEHAGCLYKGKYYITAGSLGSTSLPTNDTWVLNLKTFKWKSLRSGPVDRHCHGMWAASDKLYVLGGRRVHEGTDIPPHRATYSIENFVSFDLESKVWSSEPIIGDRPFDISEFTVLPIYEDGRNDDDPSSVIIWGGYSECDWVNGPTYEDKDGMKARYGNEHRDFHTQYRNRLLRWYPNSKVWKKLVQTSDVLPKAQSFAAEIESDDQSVNLLIGGGYGFTGESMTEKPTKVLGEQLATPKTSNKLYSVITGENGDGYASLDNIEGKSWAWDFCRFAGDKMPRYAVDFSPCSPMLHAAIDFTHEDFAEPPCSTVSPDDQGTLLGVRVQLRGLVKRPILNGSIGRCGRWLEKRERYQVFIPNHEKGGPCSISVKPSNLAIATPLKPLETEEIQDLMATSKTQGHMPTPKKFPAVTMSLMFEHDASRVKRPIADQIIDPPQVNCGHPISLHDTYHGPVSRQAQAILRTISLPETIFSPMMSCILSIDCRKVGAPHREEMENRLNIYSDFVKQLKAENSHCVKDFEDTVMDISESKVKATCGKWLRLKIEVDGMLPPGVSRDLLVSPDITMQSLHNHVLCPAIGWAPYNHAYAFRRTGMCFSSQMTNDNDNRAKEDHEYAMHMMDAECWIGPNKSSAVDTMWLPLYIGGCIANDKHISLGQLFALDDGDKMFLQYVADLGCWWSHNICVTKYDESNGIKIPSDATVAHLIGGEGGSIPEDCGGMQSYNELIHQLTGKLPVEHKSHKGIKSTLNPSMEQWWDLFNGEYRGKANRIHFLSNPFGFQLERTRVCLETELRRPKRKTRNEGTAMRKVEIRTGLAFEMDKKCTVSLPKKPTDSCAFCGITVALKLCSACKMVAYCSKEHSIAGWPNHKKDCKRARKKQNKE